MNGFLAAAACLLVLTVASVVMGCPNCRDALAENDPTHGGLARGFYWSIILMMSMPFALVAGFSGYMYLEVRKARRLGRYGDPLGSAVAGHFPPQARLPSLDDDSGYGH